MLTFGVIWSTDWCPLGHTPHGVSVLCCTLAMRRMMCFDTYDRRKRASMCRVPLMHALVCQRVGCSVVCMPGGWLEAARRSSQGIVDAKQECAPTWVAQRIWETYDSLMVCSIPSKSTNYCRQNKTGGGCSIAGCRFCWGALPSTCYPAPN